MLPSAPLFRETAIVDRFTLTLISSERKFDDRALLTCKTNKKTYHHTPFKDKLGKVGMNLKLQESDFLSLFGEADEDNFYYLNELKRFITLFNFEYAVADRELFEESLLEILVSLQNNMFDKSGNHRLEKWEKGWGENLTEFIRSDFDTKKLVPKYYRGTTTSRLRGEIIETRSPTFQYDFFQVLRFYITKKFLSNCKNIFEFACGPGHNIVAISEIINNDDVNFQGLDWSKESVKIIDEIAKRKNINCKGREFDFYSPDSSLSFPMDSILLTFGGLEQVGENHEKFLNFILHKKPSLCINVEPIHEFYDKDLFLDFLANSYHHSRNYLRNYLSKLLLLEKRGNLQIEKISRVQFGGIYHEGWNILVWKPL